MMVTMMVAVMRYAGERWGRDHGKQQYSNEFLHERNLAWIWVSEGQNSRVNPAVSWVATDVPGRASKGSVH